MRVLHGLSVEIRVVEDAEAAARVVAERLVAAVSAGRSVALSGGSTPRRAYELAAALEPDWSLAEVWWGDERCVPPEDERSNFRLAREALLDRLERAPAAVHRIRGELDPAEAAAAYERELALAGVTLGLVLLGIGPDGHTASLFPGSSALAERERLALPVHALGLDRVTLTRRPLEAADEALFLAVGEEKAEAVRHAFAEKPGPETPASLVRGRHTTAVLDRAAAARLC